MVYISYFSNFVLLGSFLGIGLGFLRGNARLNLFPYAPVALAFLVGLVLIFPVRIDRSGSDLIYFGHFDTSGLPVWITLPFIFAAVAGDTVTWTNRDDIPHTVVAKNLVFKSKAMDTDDAYSFTFTTPGEYAYFCSLHPHMTGIIVVQAATGGAVSQ